MELTCDSFRADGSHMGLEKWPKVLLGWLFTKHMHVYMHRGGWILRVVIEDKCSKQKIKF